MWSPVFPLDWNLIALCPYYKQNNEHDLSVRLWLKYRLGAWRATHFPLGTLNFRLGSKPYIHLSSPVTILPMKPEFASRYSFNFVYIDTWISFCLHVKIVGTNFTLTRRICKLLVKMLCMDTFKIFNSSVTSRIVVWTNRFYMLFVCFRGRRTSGSFFGINQLNSAFKSLVPRGL